MFLMANEVAAHLRLVSLDEPEIGLYIDAACAMVEELTGATYTFLDVPPRVKAAALLLVADMYENREASSTDALRENPTFMRLLMPHRVF
jgi:hypothetical protein